MTSRPRSRNTSPTPANSHSRSSQPRLRCAIYTRKSTEEGLDQEFNSLDAQREACAAFITSQVGLGWHLIPDRYDDGGISGGTMERPALQRLLQDIKDRRVDVVVVYKIDRLTRSLADFAKIVEVFDGQSVSFVSVTQQFNTTSSMGRLTLNVLLSFAQFEREVTAERIRDKIAASRKKGMWMGGNIPLGYTIIDRKMVIDRQSADIVRHMFHRVLELGSVSALLAELRDQYPKGIFVGEGVGRKAPHASSLSDLSPSKPKLMLFHGALTYLLRNRTYIGLVRHIETFHEGEHEPIVQQEIFDRVQILLKRRSAKNLRITNTKNPLLLRGLLYDQTGCRFRTDQSANHGKLYRYYVSSGSSEDGQGASGGWRLPAAEIDNLIIGRLAEMLRDQQLIAVWMAEVGWQAHIGQSLERAKDLVSLLTSGPPPERRRLLNTIIHRIIIAEGKIFLEIDTVAAAQLISGGYDHQSVDDASKVDRTDPDGYLSQTIHRIEMNVTLARRAYGTRIIVDGHGNGRTDERLVELVARANYFAGRLTDGTCSSVIDVANELNIHRADISRILPLAFLAPNIVDKILTGTQPGNLTPAYLRRELDLPAAWADQVSALLR